MEELEQPQDVLPVAISKRSKRKQSFAPKRESPSPPPVTLMKPKISPRVRVVPLGLDEVKVEEEVTATTARRSSRHAAAPKVSRGKKAKKKNRTISQRCDLCSESIHVSKMVGHLETHHVKEYITPCSYPTCPRVFSCRGKMERHLKGHYDYDTSHVAVGGLVFPVNVKRETCHEEISRYSFRTHLQAHEQEVAEKTLSCPMPGCPERYGLRQSVEAHLFSHDLRKKEQKCPVCQKLFNIDQIESHFKDVHQVDQVIPCKRCPLIFPSWAPLLDHLFEHRFNTLGGLPCDLCDDSRLKFIRYDSLRQHYFNVHQIGNTFVCEHCDREFFTERTLSRHKKQAHSNQNDNDRPIKGKPGKRYKCDLCPDVTFGKTAALRTHKVKLHGAPPPTCKFCQKVCLTPFILGRHEATHLGLGRTYKCGVEGCGEVFDKVTVWKKHKRLAHNPNPSTKLFICDTCGKGYTKKYNLMDHVSRIHLGKKKEEPRRICEICGESFASSETLRTHKLIHTGQRPYKCSECNQAFRHRSALLTHLKGHQEKGRTASSPMVP